MPELLTIELKIEIKAPPKKVWQVFSSAERMQKWMGLLGYQPKVGSEYIMHVNAPDGKVDFYGEVTTYDPPKELAFTWTQQEAGKQPWPVSTLVTLKLIETKTGTQVKLIHSGFEALAEDIAEHEYQGHIIGWERSQALSGLKELVEHEN